MLCLLKRRPDPLLGSLNHQIEEFVASDPYFLNGLVSGYTIREWTVVVE